MEITGGLGQASRLQGGTPTTHRAGVLFAQTGVPTWTETPGDRVEPCAPHPPQGPCGYCPHPATRQGGGATGSQLLPLPCSSDAHSFFCRLSLSSDPVQDST